MLDSLLVSAAVSLCPQKTELGFYSLNICGILDTTRYLYSLNKQRPER